MSARDAAPHAAFLEALRAPRPIEYPGHSWDMYAKLIGTWDAEVVDHLPDGSERRRSAEIHFAWVLEGRAIQDLWISPARRERAAPSRGPAPDGDRYGTTLRIYDPASDVWRITWWNPVTGVETRLVGRRVRGEMVHTGTDFDGRLIRWVFDDVRPDTFHWRGEWSEDGGRTWVCDTEYFARRRQPSITASVPESSLARHIRWEWIDRPGMETVSIERLASGTVARGSVLVVLDAVALRASYRIVHDVTWRFLEAHVEAGPLESPRTLQIRRSSSGRWEVDGAPRPDLDGCEDVDLMITPYTNTPPLAARALAPGESRRLCVAWVRFPDLHVEAVEQEYTRLDAGTIPSRYRYRNLKSGFTGELTVDGDGLVIDYGSWRRQGDRETS